MITVANPTDLSRRMSLHTPGQVTWPEPELKAKCSDCGLFRLGLGLSDKKKQEGFGRCGKAFEVAGKSAKPVAFIGSSAIACPQMIK